MQDLSPQYRSAVSICVIAVFAMSVGISSPLFALALGARGVDTFAIGANAAMTPAGVLTAAFLTPRLAHKSGLKGLGVAACVVGASAFCTMRWFPSLLF